ncbi:hypothetical protein [Flavobacterium sp.]|uniref:hypothetical protein n=1 Tax=Flavobacterium sp. TaxID=239 RepID=UPI002611BDD0|nr:hypothetical protein [Flavobacterium sp.]MDD3005378.1 hypothetical protein [Flavobacterium sp.]
MNSTLQRLAEIKKTGYTLDLGDTLNNIFSNYKNIALLGGLVILLVFIVAIVIFGGAAALFLGVNALTQTVTDYSEGVVTNTALILGFVASTIGAGLFAPVVAGIIQMAHNSSINEDFDFGTAFMHYKSVHFKEIFLSAALLTVIGSAAGLLIELYNLNNPNIGFQIVGNLISNIFSALIQIFTLLTIPLIIFGKLNAIEAIKGSFVLVSKNFWIILLLAIVCGLFVLLGLFALCIGILFTFPVIYSMQYVIYKSALPIDEENELDEIGENRF